MSNKVTNIYIDTTGFCDEALERVRKAVNTIVEYNGVDSITPAISGAQPSIVFFGGNGQWHRLYIPEYINGTKQVGLWELESIASRCKHEKKEESLPTRNIYIDARKLTQEQRLNAYGKVAGVASGEFCGWLPSDLACGRNDDSSLILFDIFVIDGDGDRRFYSGAYIDDMKRHIENPKELTYDQLMSIVR